jgi:hypothetical protein
MLPTNDKKINKDILNTNLPFKPIFLQQNTEIKVMVTKKNRTSIIYKSTKTTKHDDTAPNSADESSLLLETLIFENIAAK